MRISVFLLLSAMIVSGCDVVSTTNYYFDNRLDEGVKVFMKFSSGSELPGQDTTIYIASNSRILYSSVEKLSKDNFSNLDVILEVYDSIVAIRDDSVISSAFAAESEWTFKVVDDENAEYKLTIDESDF